MNTEFEVPLGGLVHTKFHENCSLDQMLLNRRAHCHDSTTWYFHFDAI